MKMSEIVIGGIYSNKKTGNKLVHRKVLRRVPCNFIFGPHREDCLEYEILLTSIKNGEYKYESKKKSTLPSFAKWAKEKIN